MVFFYLAFFIFFTFVGFICSKTNGDFELTFRNTRICKMPSDVLIGVMVIASFVFGALSMILV